MNYHECLGKESERKLGPKIGPNSSNFGTRTLHARNQHIYYVVVFMYGACTLPSYQSFAVKWKSNQILSFDIFLNEFSATVQVLVTLGFNSKILF